MSHELDFDQIGRTCEHNVSEIHGAFSRARVLGIRFLDLQTKRDETERAIEQLLGDRIRQGGMQVVDDATWDRWVELEGIMCGIWTGLDRVFSCHDHYREEKAQHDRKVINVDRRPARVRIADGVEPNKLLDGLVAYASNSAGVLSTSNAHFVTALDALKSRDIAGYHVAIQTARTFGNREWALTGMIEKGKLVEVDEEVEAAA
jgi:hypothetical protein